MAAMIERSRKRLSKRAKKGFRGWPLATIALYGPDDSTATKLTVGIVPAEDAEATATAFVTADGGRDIQQGLIDYVANFTEVASGKKFNPNVTIVVAPEVY